MSKFIDSEAFFEAVNTTMPISTNYFNASTYNKAISDVLDMLARFPASDVVEVVRCRECKHKYGYKCDYDDRPVGRGDYCSRGVRRGEVEE